MPVGPYFADFLCREQMLIIELDGASHDVTQVYDKERDAHMRALGYRILRFQNADVTGNIEGVLLAIAQAWSDGPTPGPSRLREGSDK